MDTQIYLMLVRQVGKFPKKKDLKAGPALALIVKQALQSFVLGDSLDVPFVKMIRVQGISHGIAYEGGAKSDKADSALRNRPSRFLVKKDTEKYDYDTALEARRTRLTESVPSFLFRNKFAKAKVPAHNEFTFTKHADNATPQLAFACSAQEAFPFALFFLRRKGGFGAQGIRSPFLSIGLYKSVIRSWEIDNELVETVKLEYSSIAWSSMDTWGDSELPLGIPAMRYWHTDDAAGGETGWGLLLQLVAQALTAAAAAPLAVQAAMRNDEFSAE